MNEFLRRLRLWIEAAAENRAGVWGHVAGWAVAWLVLIVIIAIASRELPPLLGMALLIIAASLVFGFASYGWQLLAPRLRSWASSPRNIGKAVLAVAVVGVALLVIANAPLHGAATAVKFYYPATLTDSGWLVLLLVFAFFTPRAQGTEQTAAAFPFGRMRQPDGSENARFALGLAVLAVVALALWRSQKDLAAVGGALPQFFGALPSHWHMIPLPGLIGGAVLLLLAAIGLFQTATGWRGPFLKRGLRGAGGDIFWLIAAAGLWLWGAFLPRDFEWFDALDMPGALRTVNFGLLALYLFTVVHSGVAIALQMGRNTGPGPGPVQDDIDRQKKRWAG